MNLRAAAQDYGDGFNLDQQPPAAQNRLIPVGRRQRIEA